MKQADMRYRIQSKLAFLMHMTGHWPTGQCLSPLYIRDAMAPISRTDSRSVSGSTCGRYLKKLLTDLN